MQCALCRPPFSMVRILIYMSPPVSLFRVGLCSTSAMRSYSMYACLTDAHDFWAYFDILAKCRRKKSTCMLRDMGCTLHIVHVIMCEHVYHVYGVVVVDVGKSECAICSCNFCLHRKRIKRINNMNAGNECCWTNSREACIECMKLLSKFIWLCTCDSNPRAL